MNLQTKGQNIKVGVRCRPMTKSEGGKERNVVKESRDGQVLLDDRNKTTRTYKFDYSFDSRSKQMDIYKAMVAPLVDEVISGYNCTLFAYGQTGTGKTFTMTGERSDRLRYSWHDDPSIGMIPRAVGEIFDKLQSSDEDFAIRVSLLELYNEELYDLLSDKDDMTSLKIFDDSQKKGSITIKNLQEVNVEDKDNVYAIIEKGLAKRHTAATKLNLQSSRSHSIFIISVHIKEFNKTSGEEYVRIGKFNLVDLAGSENIGRSGAVDRRAREAGLINQSLLTLGRVITSLVDRNSHIPYRESKLTRILQDSLGGSTKTSIIATISPCFSSIEETLSTLEYANRAKSIQNKPEVNQKMSKNEMIKNYNIMVERLRKDLDAARTKKGFFVDEENYKSLQEQLELQRERINLIEDRKEYLEEELETINKNFKLTEEEKLKYKSECDSLTNSLRQIEKELDKVTRQLRETNEIRKMHRRTEMALHNKASKLIETTKLSIGDNEILHSKIDQLIDLDKENKRKTSIDIPESMVTGFHKIAENFDKANEKIQLNTDEILSEMNNTQETIVSKLLADKKEMSINLCNLKDSIIDRENSMKEFVEKLFEKDAEVLENFLDSQNRYLETATKSCQELGKITDDHLLKLDSHCQHFVNLSNLLKEKIDQQNSVFNQTKEQIENLQRDQSILKVNHDKLIQEAFDKLKSNSDEIDSKFLNASSLMLTSMESGYNYGQSISEDLEKFKSEIKGLTVCKEKISSENKNSINALESSWKDSIVTSKKDISSFFADFSEKRFVLQEKQDDYLESWREYETSTARPCVDFVKLEQQLESQDYQNLVSIPIDRMQSKSKSFTTEIMADLNKTSYDFESFIKNQEKSLKNAHSEYRTSGGTPLRRGCKDYGMENLSCKDLPKTKSYRTILSELRKTTSHLNTSNIDDCNQTFNYSVVDEPDYGETVSELSVSRLSIDESRLGDE